MNISVKKYLGSLLILLIVLIGIFLRTYVYLQDVSFFHDEGGLALNLIERSYGQLFFHLDYCQQAPPFFLVMSKFMISKFGVSELVLRFMPYLFSVASLILFSSLCFKIFKNYFSVLVAVFLCSFSVSFVHFAQVFTKYSSDIFCTILSLFFVFTVDFKKWNIRKTLLLSLLTVISFWFSYTMVFNVFCFGLVFLIKAILEKKSYNIKKFMLFLAVNAVGIILYILINLYASATSTGLYNCWVTIWGFFPKDFNDIKNLFLFHFNITSIVGIVITCLFFILGCITWYKKDIFRFWILFLPIPVVFIAGALHLYPASDRLLLFVIPNVIIILVSPVESVLFEKSLFAKALVISLFAVFLESTHYIPYFITYIKNKYDYERSGVREYVSLLRKEKIEKNDIIFANLHCKESFQFYTKNTPISLRQIIYEEPFDPARPLKDMEKLPHKSNVYFFIFYNLLTPKSLHDMQLDWIDKHCIVKKDIKMKNKRFVKCYII